ncbi:MAG: ABC transporter ATP-binding protein [Acidimicrobiia bacterium]
MSILECEAIDAGYQGLAVARGVSFALAPGEVLAILGPNGAGKTTILLTLAGFLKPLAGTIRIGEEPIRPGRPRRMNRAGVVLVPDNRALFTQLTVAETLSLGARSGGMSVDEVYDLFPALRDRARLKAGALSGGEQQMLALARALVQQTRVLLIDEMSMGLAPMIVESLMEMVRRIADETGAGVVLVEQHVGLALDVADHALVLVHGDVVLSAPVDALRSDLDSLDAAYLGRTGERDVPA